jgi:hypothetical protein
VACWPVFEVDKSASPQTRGAVTGSKNAPRPASWRRIAIT